jgi:hypothetical protein
LLIITLIEPDTTSIQNIDCGNYIHLCLFLDPERVSLFFGYF